MGGRGGWDELEDERDWSKSKRREVGLSCMLNTEVGAILAVIRRPHSELLQQQQQQQQHLHNIPPYIISTGEDTYDSSIQQSLKSLRALIFEPQQKWRTIDPSIYVSPILDVIQSDDIPAPATGVALSALLNIIKVHIFDHKTPGAKDAINLIVLGITNCKLEKTDSLTEDAVMMKILQVLAGLMNHRASYLLNDQSVCTIVNTCFNVVQQSATRGDLLQRTARYTMKELIQIIFSRLPEIEVRDGEDSESDTEDADLGGCLDSGYGIRCVVDVFHFLCSLLNVVEMTDMADHAQLGSRTADEDVQLFALVLINSAIELSGDAIGKHPKLLRMVQDDLFHHLIHYGACSNPLVLSMICSTVLNVYHFLRRFVRLQLEAFFVYVVLRLASFGSSIQIQEVALEGIINFCRQSSFILEFYVNYDCDPLRWNLFEEIGKLLCKLSFPTGSPLTTLQIQAFEGLVIMIHNIAEKLEKQEGSRGATTLRNVKPAQVNEYRPFWEEKSKQDFQFETWIDYVRVRKAQKKKLLIAGHHFNRDEKKGLAYLKLSQLVSDPPDPKPYAFFFRYTQGLDKQFIGEYLGDPDQFHLRVLTEFTHTFEFTGMILDTALRTYLETFRLPGESQKIQRILETFSERFYDMQSSNTFASKDTVFVLCYSLIMLNTDLHNPQVKKKMSEDDFIKNNRQINAGKDLPRDYLSELFHSISNHAIIMSPQSGNQPDMNPSKWVELMNRSKVIQPLILCEFDPRLGRDMFACVAGPSVASLAAFFEHADEDEMLNECIEGLFSIAKITQYGLEDTLDELLAMFSKFTTLLNPYASAEETLFVFSHDLKPKLATLAVFTIANNFGDSIRGGWRNIVDCLLKLKRLKLIPQSVLDSEVASSTTPNYDTTKSDSGVIFPSQDPKFSTQQSSGMASRFSQFLSLDSSEDSLSLNLNEFEQNLKFIKQCRIGSIFSNSSNLREEALLNLGRSLIFAAAGKGQKFATSIEEEETVGFCWDLITTLGLSNVHRFQLFWPSFHEYLQTVVQFPLFSATPFVEKAVLGLFKVCLKLLSSYQPDKLPEELIFKSMYMMLLHDKEILDTCCEPITQSVSKIIIEYPANLQTTLGWKSLLHLLSVSGRHPATYDQGVEALIMLMSDGTHITRANYNFCMECALNYVTLKNSPLEKNLKILDLLSSSVSFLVQWYRNYCAESGNNHSAASNASSSSSVEDKALVGGGGGGGGGSSHFATTLFLKLGDTLRKTSLIRREEIRNHAIICLKKSFVLAEELDFTPANCISFLTAIIFAMVDDLHEKMLEYSRRDNAEREARSMEGTLKISMELLTDVYLLYLKQISQSCDFRTFWLGILRRMDTCMKADLGNYGESSLKDLIPNLLCKLITDMKEKEILVKDDGDGLWGITCIQIQWIAPAIKDELFPEENF